MEAFNNEVTLVYKDRDGWRNRLAVCVVTREVTTRITCEACKDRDEWRNRLAVCGVTRESDYTS